MVVDDYYCRCKDDHYISSTDISHYDSTIFARIECKACQPGFKTSSDAMFCFDSPSSDDDARGSGSGDAGTCDNRDRTETGAEMQPPGVDRDAVFYSVGEKCVVCSSPNMRVEPDGNDRCECDVGYNKYNGRCFEDKLMEPDDWTKELLPAAHQSCKESVNELTNDTLIKTTIK